MENQDYIYVVMSFRLYAHPSNPDIKSEIEPGKRFWLPSQTDVEVLFEHPDVYGDSLYECRWNYVVVERVPAGPYPENEVIGWWKAEYDEEKPPQLKYTKLSECPIPGGNKMFNFTELGTGLVGKS